MIKTGRHHIFLKVALMALLLNGVLCPSAYAYRALTDKTNGGNPKLAKKAYKIYIQDDPTSNHRGDEVKEALRKWANELFPRGVDLQVQTGNPPEQPLDLNQFNKEAAEFNKDPSQDLSKFPEIQKAMNKSCTVSVYFDTTANIINRRGGGAKRGFASNFWTFDDKGRADTIDASDVFLPTDPPGATEDVKKRILHNIALHEFGHVGGLDHYTPAQEKTGDVMETDATLHGTKLDIGPEEKKGLDAFYGPKPKVKIQSSADNKQSSSLAPSVQSHIPAGMDRVWEYTYDLAWEEGSPVSYFHVEIQDSSVFVGTGSGGLEDWLFALPMGSARYLEFYADEHYLGSDVFSGRLQFYSGGPPGRGWLAHSGFSEIGIAPVPEPSTLILFAAGLFGACLRKREL